MVTKRQIKRLKRKLEPGIGSVEEIEIYLVGDDGSIETPTGEIITQNEYDKRLKEEREAGEEIAEIITKGAEFND